MGWNCISIYECWIQIGHMYTNALKYMYIKKKDIHYIEKNTQFTEDFNLLQLTNKPTIADGRNLLALIFNACFVFVCLFVCLFVLLKSLNYCPSDIF